VNALLKSQGSGDRGAPGFRAKLLVGIMLVVSLLTGAGLYFVLRGAASNFEEELQRDFQGKLDSQQRIQEIRYAALTEHCRSLARRSRIHAALEDDALDLLYPSASDELRDLTQPAENQPGDPSMSGLHARYYRFLDIHGAVISPPNPDEVGRLSGSDEAQLALRGLPPQQQIGYLYRGKVNGEETVDELIAVPIASMETGEVISALVLGFKFPEWDDAATGIKSGIWLNGRAHLPTLGEGNEAALSREITASISSTGGAGGRFTTKIGGVPHLVFFNLVNRSSLFAPAYEVCIYPLTDFMARQRRMRWQIIGGAAFLIPVGLAGSQVISSRLSKPVEQLAEDSVKNRVQRELAEAALESTHRELERSARFSADTSHQLKTPVTVLRAGLEELRSHPNLTHDTREEIAALIHQTFRITSIVEDLLLLSRMDAGRLQIEKQPVNINRLIERMQDDLCALPDGLDIETDFDGPVVFVQGEERYISLILQNLMENARKYNRQRGRISIGCRAHEDWVLVTIGNTGVSIAPEGRERIFERFHRGAANEDRPGHGLGLNLARELARLHGGDLRLLDSRADWTEFEVRFRVATVAQIAVPTDG
jgi:signal transduction histidine kinase